MKILGVFVGAWAIAVLLVGVLAWQGVLDTKMEIRDLKDEVRLLKSGH
jgi:hypothetical protein